MMGREMLRRSWDVVDTFSQRKVLSYMKHIEAFSKRAAYGQVRSVHKSSERRTGMVRKVLRQSGENGYYARSQFCRHWFSFKSLALQSLLRQPHSTSNCIMLLIALTAWSCLKSDTSSSVCWLASEPSKSCCEAADCPIKTNDIENIESSSRQKKSSSQQDVAKKVLKGSNGTTWMVSTDELGSGAYGSVRVGRCTETGELVAVKEIRSIAQVTLKTPSLQDVETSVSLGSKTDGRLARTSMRREVQALQVIKSQGGCKQIVDLKDVIIEGQKEDSDESMDAAITNLSDEDGGGKESVYYIITELLPGVDLFSFLEEHEATPGRGLEEGLAAHIIMEIALALEFMHLHGIIHKDVKPENILLSPSKPTQLDAGQSRDWYPIEVKLIDFGSSTSFNSASSQEAAELVIPGFAGHEEEDKDDAMPFGTISYLPPEVLQGGNSTTAMDIWALGIILALLLTQSHPFDNKLELDVKEVTENICRRPLAMKGRRWRRVSDDAKELVRKMLSKDPSQRPTASDVLSDRWIKRCLRSSP